MDKKITYTLDLLNEKSVSVKKETYITIDEKEYLLERTRVAYTNSNMDRATIKEELPEAYSTAIFAVWGTEPIVEDLEAPVIVE
jgi:hypothetical protein